ncbi:MAG TPA: F0F1 ATP synthase subunit epsilon [Nitriliruptorales bacterium]
MANTMTVEVVSAEKSLLSVEATEVYGRSLDGEIGILPGHQPVLLALDIAPLKVKLADGGEERVAVHNGFLFFKDNHLVILADLAELASQIDVRRAERHKHELEQQDREQAEVRASLKKQELRLRLGS